jgi:hypothetical protein
MGLMGSIGQQKSLKKSRCFQVHGHGSSSPNHSLTHSSLIGKCPRFGKKVGNKKFTPKEIQKNSPPKNHRMTIKTRDTRE